MGLVEHEAKTEASARETRSGLQLIVMAESGSLDVLVFRR